MSVETGHHRFDFRDMTPRERYKLLIGTVIPRPIAFVTTVDEAGRANAAPFSFFNCLTADPAIVVIGVENHADMSYKDTARNIRVTGEFTVHIVDHAMRDAMNVCAVPFPPEVDELAMAGLTALPGTHVKSPRIAEAPAALECRRYVTLEVGRSREIILGEVLAVFLREGIVDTERKYVDQSGMDAIGRMGGHGYVTTRDYFDLPTMSVAEWQQRQNQELASEASGNEVADAEASVTPSAGPGTDRAGDVEASTAGAKRRGS